MSQASAELPLRSGRLASLVGISADTLRYYEKMGVLPPPHRTTSGYRQYPASAVGRVRLIRQALASGFTLSDLKRILLVRDQGGAPCREVRGLAAVKLQQIEGQLADLKTMRDHLRKVLRDWDRRLVRTPQGQRAGLLESLPPLPKESPSRKRGWQ